MLSFECMELETSEHAEFVVEGEVESQTVLVSLAFASKIGGMFRTTGDRRAKPRKGHRAEGEGLASGNDIQHGKCLTPSHDGRRQARANVKLRQSAYIWLPGCLRTNDPSIADLSSWSVSKNQGILH